MVVRPNYILPLVALMAIFNSFGAIQLSDSKHKEGLELTNTHIELLEDSIDLTVEEVLQEIALQHFHTPKATRPENSNLDHVYWVKFKAINLARINNYIVDIHSPNAERITLYAIDQKGHIITCGETGLQVPLAQRKYTDKNLLIDLYTGSYGDTLTYLARVEKGGFCRFNFHIVPVNYFMFFSKNEYCFLGVFYGIVLIMMVYNLILFLSFRKGVYLWYILLMLAGALKTLSEDRLGGLYFWQELPHLSYYLGIHIAPNLILAAFIGYSFQFLNLKFNRNSNTLLVLLSTAAHYLFYGVTSIFFGDVPYSDSLYFLPFLVVFILAVKSRKSHGSSLFFVVGTGIFLAATVIDELRHQRIIFGEILIVFSFHITLVIQSLILSLSILSRLKGIRERQEYLTKKNFEQEKANIESRSRLRHYTDMAHELRTHLTLVLGPLQKSIKLTSEGTSPNEQLALAKGNADRILTYVNQIIDLRRLEMDVETINPKVGDLISFCTEIIKSVEGFAENNNTPLVFETNAEDHICSFDPLKLEKIIFNLLSNAVKYSEPGEPIQIRLEVSQHEMKFRVEDAGVGIDDVQRRHIFERFYQTKPDNELSSGIGLEQAKRLIDLLNGRIDVFSEKGKGSVFVVTLPIEPLMQTPINASAINLQDVPSILVVDDNKGLRDYLASEISDDYQVYQADNGTSALRILDQGYSIHAVVSDVNMPLMNGVDLCEKLKTSDNTKDIPVLLLTVNTDKKDLYDGLEARADDYIAKPFDIDELKKRIRNRIEKGKKKEQPRDDHRNTFELNIKNIIHKNLDDTALGVEMLCHELGESRTQLYRKTKTHFGKSVKELIREERLLMARMKLSSTSLSVKEVMYDVGFENRQYFAKCFKTYFGYSPSECREKT